MGQVIYGLPSTIPVTLEMMANHGAAVVRGSYHSVVVVDMPFGSYEASKEQAFESASYLLKETGAAAVKLEGGEAMAETVAFLNQRGIPVMGHVGLTPQAVNVLGGVNTAIICIFSAVSHATRVLRGLNSAIMLASSARSQRGSHRSYAPLAGPRSYDPR